MSIAYLFLCGAFLLNAAANILLKTGAQRGLELVSYNPFLLVVRHWELVLGLFLFALNAVFYFLALRTLPLSVAYPVMVGMGFLIVGGYAAFMLGEQITTLHIAGYVLILVGIVLIVGKMS